MKKLLLITITSLLTLVVKAQTSSNILAILNDINRVYSDQADLVEPQFPGGVNALNEYTSNIARNLKKIDGGVKGAMYIDFLVEKDGHLSDLKIRYPFSGKLNEEALKEVREMPKWIPATVKGKPVRVMYTIPIHF